MDEKGQETEDIRREQGIPAIPWFPCGQPDSKIDETVELFQSNFYSKKKFDEFALLLYWAFNEANRQKPIATKIFTIDSKEPYTMDAKFEYVGKCDGDDNADFVIISY